MSANGVNHFSEEIHRVVDYFRKEYRMTLAEAVGTLQIVALQLAHDALHSLCDDDGTDG